MKTSVYIAESLDGFIARVDDGLDWLPVPEGDQDYGYGAFMETVDVLVMGRRTFETVLGFGAWSYTKPVVVLSSRPVEIPADIRDVVEWMDGAPADVVEKLSRRGAQHLYIDGGQTIQRFLNAGLITDLIITRVPVLLGSGIALFGPQPNDIALRHVGTQSFASGLVQSTYTVV